jgi:hypothetical protein
MDKLWHTVISTNEALVAKAVYTALFKAYEPGLMDKILEFGIPHSVVERYYLGWLSHALRSSYWDKDRTLCASPL